MSEIITGKNTKREEVLEEVAGILVAYYQGVEKACNAAFSYAEHLANRPLFAEYVYHSKFLLKEVRTFIDDRRTIHLPYIQELAGKSTSGHDCMHCSGRCDMQHTVKMLELVSSLKKIESTVSYMQSELEAIYKNEELKGSLRWLSNAMEGVIDRLLNTFQYEDVTVIPRIKAAQKNINAHS